MRLTLLSWAHVPKNITKAFCPDWHTKGAKSTSGGFVCPICYYSLTPKTQESKKQGKDRSRPKVAWRFNRGTWFLMASPSDPGFMLTLVSQGHTHKNPGCMRWSEGRLERTRSYFNMIKCLLFGKLTFLFLFFIYLNVSMSCHSSEMI